MKNLILILVLVVIYSCKKDKPVYKIDVTCKPNYFLGHNLDFYNIVNDTIRKNETFGIILDRYNVPYHKINNIVEKVKDTFDLRALRAGKPYTILTTKEDTVKKAKAFVYKHNLIDKTVISFKDTAVLITKHKEPVTIIEKEVAGQINTNLWFAMDSLGLKANLIYKIADEIYPWTLDFQRLHKGDTFKIIFEEKYVQDSIFAGYGNVKAAVFTHGGENLYAYRYITDSIKNIEEYYDDKANVLRSQFLKSPIKFKYRISSKYNLRRRIALYGNKVRPHLGTDFAAPIGTPIMTTANGVVTESTYRGGNGNYVKVKHNATYSTQYLHMRKRKVKVGDYVKQGDIIGWIGMTGNTSGPHVCYRFWKNGKQVDPFKQKLPSAKPLEESKKTAYFEYIAPLKNKLDSIKLIQQKKDTLANQKENDFTEN